MLRRRGGALAFLTMVEQRPRRGHQYHYGQQQPCRLLSQRAAMHRGEVTLHATFGSFAAYNESKFAQSRMILPKVPDMVAVLCARPCAMRTLHTAQVFLLPHEFWVRPAVATDTGMCPINPCVRSSLGSAFASPAGWIVKLLHRHIARHRRTHLPDPVAGSGMDCLHPQYPPTGKGLMLPVLRETKACGAT